MKSSSAAGPSFNTVIAHHILVVVGHLLTPKQAYRGLSHERIAHKFLTRVSHGGKSTQTTD